MKNRFKVTNIFISPIYCLENGDFRRDLEYPLRACIIDTYQGIAIDIKTNLKYDYVETMSYLYTSIMKDHYKKIDGQRRLAVCEVTTLSKLDVDLNEVEDIKKALESGYEFMDGNDVFSNEQYLAYLEREEQIEQQKESKTKSKVKNRRKKRK